MRIKEAEVSKKAGKRASLFQMMKKRGNFGDPRPIMPRPGNTTNFYIMGVKGSKKIKAGTGKDYKVRYHQHVHDLNIGNTGKPIELVVLGVMHATVDDEKKFHTAWMPHAIKKTNGKHHPRKPKNEWYLANDETLEYIKEWTQQSYVATGNTFDEIDRKLARYPHIDNGSCWLPPRNRTKRIGFFPIKHEPDGSWSEYLDKVGEDSYYSPDLYTAGAREVMGGIDLDPASCGLANKGDGGAHKGVRAKTFFDISQDGLGQEWYGRVWINPPFGEWQHWSRKCEKELLSGRVTELCIFLGTTTITNSGFARLKKMAQALYIPDGRKHGNTWGPKSILTSAYQGHCLFYWGPNAEKFKEVFSEHGSVFLGVSDEEWKREAERRGLLIKRKRAA